MTNNKPWDDARIRARADRWWKQGRSDMIISDHIAAAMTEVRDDMQARIDELTAELVQALDAAIMLGEHVEMWSDAACDKDNARRARYRELTGRGWDEEEAANE